MKKYNITKHKCICGKIIDEWDYFVRTKKEIKKKNKKSYRPPRFHFVKEKRHFGYPEAYCHCNCGKKWGEHFKGLSIKELREKIFSV